MRTAEKMTRSSRCLRIGDLVYLPGLVTPLHSFAEKNHDILKNAWFCEPLKLQGLKDWQIESAVVDRLYQLKGEFCHQVMATGREPSWTRHLPKYVLSELRQSFALEELETWYNIPLLPLAGFGYAIEEGGVIEACTRTFGLARLNFVRQLGFLHDPIPRVDDGFVLVDAIGGEFNHSRGVHLHDVMAVGTLILHNNRASKDDLVHYQVAALTHDALTPAGGDTIKAIDPETFDEDAHYEHLFERFPKGWTKLRDRFNLSKERLIETVHGKGVLGKVLDIADKLSYVARDATARLGAMYDHYQHRYVLPQIRQWPKSYELYRHIFRIVDKHPLICGAWDCVRIKDGQVYFNDPLRLFQFLLLRAYLGRDLYFPPATRFLEHMLAHVVARYLYDTGKLTAKELLVMQDQHLQFKLEEVMGDYALSGIPLSRYSPRVETFATPAQAEARERALIAEGMLTLVENLNGMFKPGDHLLVEQAGKVVPFAEAEPGKARKLRQLLTPHNPVRLYYFPLAEAPGNEEFKKAYAAYRQRRLTSASQAP